jgi:hypothetical protein
MCSLVSLQIPRELYCQLTLCDTEDLLGTESDKVANPIVGSWFRIESGPEAAPPKYEYDEVGVVIEGSYTSSSRPSFRSFLFLTWVDHIGEINMRDETGQSITVKQGDTFFFPRGSTITFSSNSYGIAWKCGSRPLTRL